MKPFNYVQTIDQYETELILVLHSNAGNHVTVCK